MSFVVVIPIYNEKEHIKPLIKEILAVENVSKIIVIDDNSSDGTGGVLDELKEEVWQLKVIHRPQKLGLGTAYIEGFRLALKEDCNFILQMDGDFSHDPKYIPQMLEAIKTCDLVIGSRYISQGGIKNWSLWRRLLSKVASIYVRIITKMPLNDPTSGFKCFRRKVLEKITLDKIHSQGYAFQIEMNYLVWGNNFRIKEIPIVFYERKRGKSKLNLRIILEAMWRVWELRFGNEMIRRITNRTMIFGLFVVI
ncbi:MAG: polyprenol monophosphomannose synthase [Candidatus Omnitrophica bacterium]|nr:polyprenol monophosphomannose synthase [Candidatus Omnitrophota bacterium]